MQVRSTAHSAILSTFIKLTIVIKIFVLSIFEWPFYTGFTFFCNKSFTDQLLLTQISDNSKRILRYESKFRNYFIVLRLAKLLNAVEFWPI